MHCGYCFSPQCEQISSGAIDELYLANTAEHKGFALVISVGSNSQVHLLRVGIPLEGFGHSQDRIRRAHLNSTPP